MTDPQAPRPTLRLSLKPATLESLAGRMPKQTIVIPDKIESKSPVPGNKNNNPNNVTMPQATIANKSSASTASKQVQQKVDKEPKQTQKPKKEKIPPPVLQPYDFFEVYGKLHADFRSVISLKTPAALAIGINGKI